VAQYSTIRGTRDQLPDEVERWVALEERLRERLARYGFREIRMPLLEPTELFARGVGTETDIVSKEMYTFEGRGESVSLRPEATASVCRAYVQHGLDRANLNRLFYLGPMFRHERPQKGRYRQFHQLGVEVFGDPGPEVDAEVIEMAAGLVAGLGVPITALELGSIGDASCRPAYRAELGAFLEAHRGDLCEDCRRRATTNPLRVFDCKKESCQALLAEAPHMLDALCEPCREHFERVTELLEEMGVSYRVDPKLVRGLDYYTRTTFELRAEGLGAQDTVVGGGRYDGLVEDLGGRPTPGFGWAMGLERLLLVVPEEALATRPDPDLFVVSLGDEGRRRGRRLVGELRRSGLRVLYDTRGRALGGQMKRAGRSGARWALFLGEEELASGEARLKDLSTGEQEAVPLDDLEGLARRIRP
jgi:histidyl-tRNA synthetase